jgi:hypothetical protein
MYAVSFERFSYLVCAVFPLVPDWDGRFASQNRKMTRTPLLRFVDVCRLLRAVFLFGLRRFPARPGLDGRFASQNRKMTRTPLLRFVDVCRLLQAVFLFGLRRFPTRPGLERTFCFAKPKNDAHPASPICGCMPSPSSGFLIWSAPFSRSSRIGTDVLLCKTEN